MLHPRNQAVTTGWHIATEICTVQYSAVRASFVQRLSFVEIPYTNVLRYRNISTSLLHRLPMYVADLKRAACDLNNVFYYADCAMHDLACLDCEYNIAAWIIVQESESKAISRICERIVLSAF